jgi:hypothetical protein
LLLPIPGIVQQGTTVFGWLPAAAPRDSPFSNRHLMVSPLRSKWEVCQIRANSLLSASPPSSRGRRA